MNEESRVETELANATKAVERRDALERLCQNDDFKSIFVDGYFKEHAAAQVSLLARPDMVDKRQEVLDDLVGISSLKCYLEYLTNLGDSMEASINEYNAMDGFEEEGAE